MMIMAANPPLPFFKAVGVIGEDTAWAFARKAAAPSPDGVRGR